MNDNNNQVKLWRSTRVAPLIEFTPSKTTALITHEVVFSSARQCIAKSLNMLGMNRTDYIGIPDWSSHCVIDFVGRVATPVPLRFLPNNQAASVLVYDQWGWEKSKSARLEIKDKYQNAHVIWDRVDSLPISFESIAYNDRLQADAQIFSLKKTLNGQGGGLLWMGDDGWLQKLQANDTELNRELLDVVQNLEDREQVQKKINRFILSECDTHLDLNDWLSKYSLDSLTAQEHHDRRDRMKILMQIVDMANLPIWMNAQIDNSDRSAPGIWPLVVSTESTELIDEISDLFNFETRYYHFNFNDSYVYPEWTKVLAIPLHSELSTEVLAEFLIYIKKHTNL